MNLFDKHGVKVVIDSAFRLETKEFMIRSAQQDPMGTTQELRKNRAATSVRQLSEWGMRTIQAQFPRLKDPLLYEECGERRVILHLMVLLYNFQASAVGINQILNTFMAQKKRDDSNEDFYGYVITSSANDMFS